MNNLFIFSPLSQFEVTNLIGVNAPILGNLHLNLTNLSLYSIFVLLTILGLHIYANNDNKIIPNNWSISFESSFQSLNSMVREQIGANMEIYFPFIYSIFFYILIANLISNVPYSFAVTASGVVSLGLSLTIFIGVTILALSIHGIKFFSFFIPSGTPLALVPLLVLIELVSYLARAVSLGVRLFAIFLALVGLELAVSLIQAFVFTLLVCSYLRDAIELH